MDTSFDAGTNKGQSQSENGEENDGKEEDEGVAAATAVRTTAGTTTTTTATTAGAARLSAEAARLHGALRDGDGRGGLPLEPVEREAAAAAAREVRRSAESFAARRVSRARWTTLWQTSLGAGGSALAFFAALKLGRVRARPLREKLFFEYEE